ncbi:MAG: AEC family transporter [Spirochaetales bacterium]
MTLLLTTISNVLPLFALIFLGVILRRSSMINEEFVSTSSNLVFRIALPVMVFRRLSQVGTVPPELFAGIGLFAAVTLLVVVLLWVLLRRLPGPQSAATLQGAFRSNIAIVGLAVIEIAYSADALAYGAVVLAAIMPLYNLLAVVVLNHGARDTDEAPLLRVGKGLVRNPLMWAVLVGLAFALLNWSVPDTAERTLEYVSRLTLPLALIGIGASLDFSSMMHRRGLWTFATLVKLVAVPGLVLVGGLVIHMEAEALRVLVVTAACPTAVASFPMARALGADSRLAGEIVSATTLSSIVTLTLWMIVLALVPAG